MVGGDCLGHGIPESAASLIVQSAGFATIKASWQNFPSHHLRPLGVVGWYTASLDSLTRGPTDPVGESFGRHLATNA